MDVSTTADRPARNGFASLVLQRTAALRAGVVAGALSGALVGGIGGRIVMRIIFLIDRSTDGAKTDFATVGEITAGGTFTLLVLTTIAGVIGGLIYIAVRRWLPWSGAARGIFFGLLMMFGPGVIAVSEIDLQIFEPALPIFAMFVGLVVLYGVGVALLADRLHEPPPVQPGPRTLLASRAIAGVLAIGIIAMAVLATQNVYSHRGDCLSADDNGGCAVRASD
jgi:hypothetical protein